MERWKSLLFQVFGKKSKKKWKTVVINIMCVDYSIKQAYLFDQWSCSKEELDSLIINLQELKLIHSNLGILSVESDFLIYSLQSFQKPLSVKKTLIVDISSCLDQPVIMEEGKEKEAFCVTWTVFHRFKEFISQVNCDQLRTSMNIHHHDILVSEMVNPPCLFGLTLGYPFVYWYNRKDGDDHCLSLQPLCLYMVKGSVRTDLEGERSQHDHPRPVPSLKTHDAVKHKSEKLEETRQSPPYSASQQICSLLPDFDNNEKQVYSKHSGHLFGSLSGAKNSPCSLPEKSNTNIDQHVIFSFTIPENILSPATRDYVKNWFSLWRSTVCWVSLFSDVWMEENSVEPQAVCL